jgi:hypothetical protein
VPYDTGGGYIRPAHFHMMVSAKGYQDLITQLYFSGDQYISKDAFASSSAAKRRILEIKNAGNGEKAVVFNITMMEKLPADAAVIERLSGTYIPTNNTEKKQELYKKDNLLWIKDSESINGGYPLQYNGNNTFEYYGLAASSYHFSPQSDGSIKLNYTGQTLDNKKESWEAIKGK